MVWHVDALAPRGILALLAMGLVCAFTSASAADITGLEQAAFQSAVNRVAPAVVRIETLGGADRLGQVRLGTGPTTGLVVDSGGYILSSAFNFVHKPSSILVRLADGLRKPAKLVATDHSRMLVLLKIEVEKPLPICKIAPVGEMQAGQWAIAVGRTFESDQPNLAVGILSAVNRVWGKAVQTDAAVSPNNYGGPLVDIRGRVLGILVPLSPESADEMAGVEWYDSGIGFAIPMGHVLGILPRLKNGEDLYPGRAGFSLKGSNLYTAKPILAVCRPRSPAGQAGLKPGDRIVEIDGRSIARSAEVKEELGRRYAGQKMRMTVLRGKDRIAGEMELAKILPPFQPGFLGILPLRGDDRAGVTVRYVYPNSPAAAAGIARAEKIISLDGEPVTGRTELRSKLSARETAEQVVLEVRRGESTRKLEVVLAKLPQELPPADLPPADLPTEAAPSVETQPPPADRPHTGELRPKIPEFPGEAWAYVPQVSADVSCGVVVWLHGAGGFDGQELMARWKPLCDRYALILLAPKAADSARWMPREVAWIERLLAEIATGRKIDPTRIVVQGDESGGTQAFLLAFRNREVFRAVAAIEAVPTVRPPESDFPSPLAVYLATATQSPLARRAVSAVAALRDMNIPVTPKNLGNTPRSLDAHELAELVRWFDTLDRI
jgi:serine protease Do